MTGRKATPQALCSRCGSTGPADWCAWCDTPVFRARPCSDKPGRRDLDGHGWVGTMFGWPWTWRCVYCRTRRHGEVRPDAWVTS